MRNIALQLMYVGTAYHGWQVQKNDITVAETLEKSLAAVVGHPVKCTGAGRTDAGVHAETYVANFRTSSRIRNAFYVNRAWFYPKHLDETVMQRAASHFVGTHDFAAVQSVGTEVQSTVRTVHYFDIERRGDLIVCRVCANGFLYNMVRAMVGTCVYAAEGKFSADDVPTILENRNRTAAGPTVPPGGLYMTRLWYDTPPLGEVVPVL